MTAYLSGTRSFIQRGGGGGGGVYMGRHVYLFFYLESYTINSISTISEKQKITNSNKKNKGVSHPVSFGLNIPYLINSSCKNY